MFDSFRDLFNKLDDIFSDKYDKVKFIIEDNKPIMVILYKSVEIKVDFSSIYYEDIYSLVNNIEDIKERIDEKGVSSIKVNY